MKRLAASFEIGGRDRGLDDARRRETVLAVVRAYREAMRGFAGMRNLDVWYSRLDAAAVTARVEAQESKKRVKALNRGVAKARTKDSMRAFAKLTHVVNAEPRIRSDPPIVVPIEELVEIEAEAMEEELHNLFRIYRDSLQGDRRELVESYRLVHLARKVVGVGSVGTRAWIALLIGRDTGDPLFLQIKEAQQSVLEPYLGKSKFRNSGKRVVEGQRVMQAASDVFLGWIHNPRGIDGQPRDYYIRQLWDWKTSVDMDTIQPQGLVLYAGMCGWTLARAHARSGDRIAIASYLGRGDVFDRALAAFAATYADVNERDYERLARAAADGRIVAEPGI